MGSFEQTWPRYANKFNRPIEERFWEKVEKTDGCWIWRSARSKTGYGAFTIKHQPIRAHRLAWQLTFGPIPDGLFVCHHCDNPPCVRPDHLFLGTTTDNQRDASIKGRLKRQTPRSPEEEARRVAKWRLSPFANRPKKVHIPKPPRTACRRGHEYTPENLYIRRRNEKDERVCRACNNAAVREYTKRRHG